MGAGTSPADPAAADAVTGPEPADPRPGGGEAPEAPEPSELSKSLVEGVSGAPGEGGDAQDDGDEPGTPVVSRRFSMTHDTARPEGGGRAAPGDAPAPARQWPLLTVLCTAGAGLLIVAVDSFTEAFRVGVILIGIALLAGAVLRWVVPSVGMLAVRSRFTDLITYGIMGTLIVLLALMAQPKPWLYVPFLQDVVHFTIR